MLCKTLLLILICFLCFTQTHSHLRTKIISKRSFELALDNIDSNFQEYPLLDIDDQDQETLKVVPITKECLFRVTESGQENFYGLSWEVQYIQSTKSLGVNFKSKTKLSYFKISLIYLIFSKSAQQFFETSTLIENLQVDSKSALTQLQISQIQYKDYPSRTQLSEKLSQPQFKIIVFNRGFAIDGETQQSLVALTVSSIQRKKYSLVILFQGQFSIVKKYFISLMIVYYRQDDSTSQFETFLENGQDDGDSLIDGQLMLYKTECDQPNKEDKCWQLSYFQQDEDDQYTQSGLLSQSRMLRRRRSSRCSGKTCSCGAYPHATVCTLDRRCKCKIKTCGLGYYLLKNACVVCPASLTNYAICGPDLKKISTIICYVCNSGFILSNGACLPCPINCAGCTAVVVNSITTLSCTSCISPYVLVSSGTISTCECPAGRFLNTANIPATCDLCSITCLTCTTLPITCLSCPIGAYLDAFNTCVTCLTVCQTCISSTTCSTCPSSLFVMQTNLCVCPSPLFYDIVTNNCLECGVLQPGCTLCQYQTTITFNPYNLQSVQCVSVQTGFIIVLGSSVSCPTFCSTCSSPTYCTTCSRYDLIPNVSGECQCIVGFFSSITNSCISCSSLVTGCLSCTANLIPISAICNTCDTIGYYQPVSDPTTCLPCPQPCSQCSSDTVCTFCHPLANMIISGTFCVCDYSNLWYYNQYTNNCQTCGDVIYNCQTCYLNVATILCSTCNAQYYRAADHLSCQPCPAECSACTSATVCTSCDAGYQYVAASNTCICGVSCQTCISASTDHLCLICTTSPSFSCTQCITGYTYTAGSCQLCSILVAHCYQCSNTVCTYCASPFVLDGTCKCDPAQGLYLSADSSTCLPCEQIIPNCLYCSNITTPIICDVCQSKSYFDGTNCVLCAPECATCSLSPTNCLTCAISYVNTAPNTCVCPTGYFYDILTDGCSFCSDIISHCTTCGLVLGNLQCLDCASQYYWDSGTLSCTQCPSSCKDCLDPTTCLTCPINLVLSQTYPILGYSDVCICDDITQAGLFVNPITLYCQACADIYPGCSNCIPDTTNFDIICNVCIDPTYLDNGQCLICPETCSSCSSSTVCDACLGILPLIDGDCVCDNTCAQCLLFDPGCLSCTLLLGTFVSCSACITGMYIESGSCYSCPSACDVCASASTCTVCKPTYILSGGICVCQTYLNIFPNPLGQCTVCSSILYGCTECTYSLGNTICQSCGPGYYLNVNVCQPCDISCSTCSGPTSISCLTCLNGYTLSGTSCICDPSSPCAACSIALAECIDCIYDIYGSFDRCRTCMPGYYPVGSICSHCDSSCLTCDSDGVCLTCKSTYQVINQVCTCNNAKQMWDNGVQCLYCGLTYTNCIKCIDQSSLALKFGCLQCQVGYYIVSFACVQSVCGDGKITSGEECDDGNFLASDGCGAVCQIQINFGCVGQPSSCSLTINYHVTLDSIAHVQKQCNKISMSFILEPAYSSYQTVNFFDFLGTISIEHLNYQDFYYTNGIVTYTFQYTADIQDEQISIFFLPDNLGIPETLNLPAVPVYLTLKADNNVPLVHYSKEDCTTRDSVETVAKALEYSSYAVMALSMAPAKIVGLQLFGVLQLGHLSVGNLDEVNMMMSPLLKMKGVQGFSLSLGEQSTKKRLLASSYSPERVQAIGYESNFLRNCNIMLAVVGFAIVLSLILFLLSYCIKRCAKGLHNFSKRLIKQVLLTLILFNCFNFAYSAGIHFTYAPEDDSLYQLGTLAAVMALVLPLIMAFALVFASDEGFGEFKEKFKPGKLQRMYFFVTILYRTGIGLYISTMNSDSKSTLIVLALSIAFLLYNLVNLPYTKAYHNYRANVCHFTQFISLFVVMYYRTMLNNESVQDSATMYTPAYIELTCICISVIVSLIVLIYEIYLFFKQCYSKKEKPQKIGTEEKMQVNNVLCLSQRIKKSSMQK